MNISNQINSNLYGLVLTGGHSKRMQRDKAALSYHGKFQSEYCFELLSEFCEKVFLSNRENQANDPGHRGFPQIHDSIRFVEIGPLGGILSAMTQYPGKGFLVLACDLPYVNQKTIKHLLLNRNKSKIATAYHSAQGNFPEPVCAVYESFAVTKLQEFFNQGVYCPSKILNNSDVELITLPDKKVLDNVNDAEEFEKVKDVITRHAKRLPEK